MTGYVKALRETTAKSDEYRKTWDSLISGLDLFKTEIVRAAASATEARALSDSLMNGAVPTWNRLVDNHTRPIREAFTTNPDAIAAVGALTP